MTALLNETIRISKINFGFHCDEINVTMESTKYLDLNNVTFTFYSEGKKVGLYNVELEARFKTAADAIEEITKIEYANVGYFETW